MLVTAGKARYATLTDWPITMDAPRNSLSSRADGDRTKQNILKAAEQLFVAQGVAATSMAEIAKQAGVTKSLIHHHYGSKQELWSAVKTVTMEDYGRRQQQLMLDREPDLNLLEDSLIEYFRFMRDNPNVVRLWTWMSIENDRQCAALSHELTREGVDVTRRAQQAGYVRKDVEPEYILAQFFALVRGWFLERPVLQQIMLQGASDEECDERYLRATIRVFLDGLRPR